MVKRETCLEEIFETLISSVFKDYKIHFGEITWVVTIENLEILSYPPKCESEATHSAEMAVIRYFTQSKLFTNKFLNEWIYSVNPHLRILIGKLRLIFTHEFSVSDNGVLHQVSIGGIRRMQSLLPLPVDKQMALNQFNEIVRDYLTCYPSCRSVISRRLIDRMP